VHLALLLCIAQLLKNPFSLFFASRRYIPLIFSFWAGIEDFKEQCIKMMRMVLPVFKVRLGVIWLLKIEDVL